ncbi:MAG TPA: hydantoinase B/oxoprolinase family protein [Gammaproteobacteria bacterium]|nr:hydantoinase B/oxoprolinase family protein [Gammaproteobacteria bacterium]
MDSIELSLFSSRISAICDEMGAVLQRAAFSPNIKDRLDYSCAIFDAAGRMCAQAAHIPVHLGSMAFAMKSIVDDQSWSNGDMLILNDPYLGGTHLPDVTLISPVFVGEALLGFVVNRAHHADIGANSPGSMPVSRTLSDEGMIIPPSLIMKQGQRNADLMARLLSGVTNTTQSEGDFSAQISANQLGLQRLRGLIKSMGVGPYRNALCALNAYAERLAQSTLADIPDGEYSFSDVMDDDGMGTSDIPLCVRLSVSDHQIAVDFTGTAAQVVGNINCPLSVAAAGVYYVFRCLMPASTPACAGSFKRISVYAPEGSLLNANRPAAVAAGNVETSTRVVDVVMGALAQAIPDKMAAASQGSMNNIAMGARRDKASWNYYETLGGGMGASAQGRGLSAVQTHMTNTLNTPIESLEIHFPVRVSRYEIRDASGGLGLYRGGHGLIREFEFLDQAQVTLLTERRTHTAWGLAGGQPGLPGENNYNGQRLPPKVTLTVQAGDKLCIKTPGGGGYAWGKR